MIRVLQYLGSMTLAGSQMMIMSYYRSIDRSRVQFDFVIHPEDPTTLTEEALSLGARIYVCPRFSPKTARRYVKWWKTFFREHPEYRIVHSHIRSTASIVLSIAKKNGCTTIAHSHNTSSGKGVTALTKDFLQYFIRFTADRFIGCSQAAGEWLFGKKACASDRYCNLSNAIDVEKYRHDPALARTVREELGYTQENVVIGHVGRFARQKNHDFLIDIFHAAWQQDKRYRLLLIGNGELRGGIEEKVRALGMEEAVLFAGVRPDVNRLMQAMDVFLFPSLHEGLPVSVIEAQAAGLPCVLSDTISNEVCITDLVRCLPLDAPLNDWCAAIGEGLAERNNDVAAQIAKAGYDIRTAAEWLCSYYASL